jgi:hypothetical protein
MRCMRERLSTMAPARQYHDLILRGRIADVTARGMRLGEGSSRVRMSNYNRKLHARRAPRARPSCTPERAMASQSETHTPFIFSFWTPCMRRAYDQLCCSPFAMTLPRSYSRDPSVNSITYALLTSDIIYSPGM